MTALDAMRGFIAARIVANQNGAGKYLSRKLEGEPVLCQIAAAFAFIPFVNEYVFLYV